MRKGMAAIAAGLLASWTMPATAQSSDFERAVLAEINRARADPAGYADTLRAYRDRFDGRMVYEDDAPSGRMTIEGVRAVDEAIAFLDRQAPAGPLAEGSILVDAAQSHADTQGRDGATGHVGRDGAGPGERVRRYGGDIYVGETISYGFDLAERVVRQLIVDDGVAGRGHRALLFTPSYRFAGVGCAEHARHGSLCVVDYAATSDGRPQLPGGSVAVAAAR